MGILGLHFIISMSLKVKSLLGRFRDLLMSSLVRLLTSVFSAKTRPPLLLSVLSMGAF